MESLENELCSLHRMSCDVGKATEVLENQNELWRRWSCWSLENELCYDYNYELCSFSNHSVASPMSQLILQPFRRFTYVTLILQPFRCFTYVAARSTTLPLLQLCHRHFTYVIAHSPTLPPLHLRHSSLYNPSVASPTSQALHVLNLTCRPCVEGWKNSLWWTSWLLQVTKFRSSYSFG